MIRQSGLMFVIISMFFVFDSVYAKSMYLTKDINVEGKYLYKGSLVSCNVIKEMCCIQTHGEDPCVEMSLVSEKHIKKVDLALKNVRDSAELFVLSDNSCDAGTPIISPDFPKRAYFFSVTSSENTNDKILVELYAFPEVNGISFEGLSITSYWTGNAGDCGFINITDSELESFKNKVSEYENISNLYIDENLRMVVKLRLYSGRAEEDLSNNYIETGMVIFR